MHIYACICILQVKMTVSKRNKSLDYTYICKRESNTSKL